MNKKISILIIILVFFLCGCSDNKINSDKKNNVSEGKKIDNIESDNNKNNSTGNEAESLNIFTCNKFMYYCVKNIDMNKHKVDYIFYKKPDQINIKYYYYDIKNTPDLFIYDEYNLMDYSNNYIDKINRSKVGIINGTRGINTMSKYRNVILIGKNDNSYYWNNVENLKIVFLNIKNSIIEREPMNRKYYENNFDSILEKLNSYEESFDKSFGKLKNYTFILQGNYLQYFIGNSGLSTMVINGDDIKNANKIVNNFIDKQCSDKNKIIMLYCDNNFINIHKATIRKYNIKTFKYKPIAQEGNYENIFEYERKFLDYLAVKCVSLEK